MSEMRELYQQLIIDHGRHPRHFGKNEQANLIKEGFNPLCGDRLTIYIVENQGVIEDIRFDGVGCAISMASASLMSESLKGKTVELAKQYFEDFHRLVTGEKVEDIDRLGKLKVLAGVAEFPARVKCASLCWHTVSAALNSDDIDVTTE